MATVDELVRRAAEDEKDRLVRIAQAWQAYEGELPKPLPIRRVRTKTGSRQVDDNVVLQLPEIVVDKGRSFLFGENVDFEVPREEAKPEPTEPVEAGQPEPEPVDPGPTKEDRAQEWLDGLWERNRKMTFLQGLGLNGGVAGHVFVKIVDPLGEPRLINLDPSNVKVIWNEDDIGIVEGYIIQWSTVRGGSQGVTKRQVISPEPDSRNPTSWLMVDYESVGNTGTWREVGRETWAYPFAPIVDAQNLPSPNTYYGKSDLEKGIIGMARSINRVLSNANRILRFHAHPKTIAKGMQPDDLKVGSDEVLFVPETADVSNLEMQSDLASSFKLFEALLTSHFETARIPEVARGKVERAGNLSGVALKILYQPIIEKTQDKRLLYGELLVELNRRLLVIGGFEPYRVEIQWPEVIPTDPVADAEEATLLKNLGVSKDTLLTKLGFDAEMEKAKREVEGPDMAQAMMTAFTNGNGDALDG